MSVDAGHHLTVRCLPEQGAFQHASALAFTAQLRIRHAVVWADRDSVGDFDAAAAAVHSLFADCGFPIAAPPSDLQLLRDRLGKPFLHWQGEAARWAVRQDVDIRHVHISNTHDGGVHIIIAAYEPNLQGIGIDMVYLPRLRGIRKDRSYLSRFAGHFMSEEERAAYDRASTDDDEEQLRLRTAVHFSLMEAASKALGTGLKIGGGMGRPESLPKQSLGALQIEPAVELLSDAAARDRMKALGATCCDGYWSSDDTFAVSVVLAR